MKVDLQQIKQRFGIIGNNPALNRAIDIALQVAPTDLSVLITGESGVGKETFPQIIHQNSPRKHGQRILLLTVEPSLPEQSIRSFLATRKALLQMPVPSVRAILSNKNGGTHLFLDEVESCLLNSSLFVTCS